MAKKKDFNWKIFEEITSNLMNAQHDVKIDCQYINGSRKRQFDGYYEIEQAKPLTPIRIGIECKNFNRRVEIGKVEEFTTKIRQCRLDKGIMVSFRGYQGGAKAQAEVANIDLIEFRLSNEEDFIDRNNTKICSELVVKLIQITPNYDIKNMRIKIMDTEKKSINDLNLIKGKTDHLYNEKNEYIGSFNNFVERIVKHNRSNFKIEEENLISINWEDKDYFLRQVREDENILIKVNGFDIVITFAQNVDSLRIGSSNPSNWYIMKNIISEESVLIPRSVVEYIKRKYNIQYNII